MDYLIKFYHKVGSVWPSINEKKWQSLGPELQAKVMQAIDVARKACAKQNLDTEAGILDFFEKELLVFYTLCPARGDLFYIYLWACVRLRVSSVSVHCAHSVRC